MPKIISGKKNPEKSDVTKEGESIEYNLNLVD